VVRSSKRYKLLKFDVSWTTKRQVHVIAAILEAHAKVGDVLDESEIIEMMEANVAALETRQGGAKVWKYYKGNSDDGLMAHGNIEVV
jgi:surface antigen